MLTQRKIPFRFLSMILPVVAIGLLGYTGNIMLSAFASPENALPPSVQLPAAKLPASDSSSCCWVQVNSLNRPTPDSAHMTLNVTLTNLSMETLQISPGMQMTIKDTDGVLRNYTAAHLPKGASTGGPLKPYASRSENLDFDVPPTATAQRFSFQLDASHSPLNVELH